MANNTADINKREKREAKRDGAQLVKNSGRGFQKGDAKTDRFLIDYKFNEKSFSLTLKNWIKLQQQAWKEGQRLPIISVVFDERTKLAIVPWEIIEETGILDGRD